MTDSTKKAIWKELFPNEPMIEPRDGAVDEYAGCLAKHLPEDFNYIPSLSDDDWDTLQSNLNEEPDEKTICEIRKWAGIWSDFDEQN